MMVFDKEDTADLAVADVTPMSATPLHNGMALPASLPPTATSDISIVGTAGSFRTDTEISGRDPAMNRARELHRWEIQLTIAC